MPVTNNPPPIPFPDWEGQLTTLLSEADLSPNGTWKSVKIRRSDENPEKDKEYDMSVSPIPAMEGFKFGCDPELFVKDDKGRYVSAEGLLPGTKAAPHPVEFGAVQVDGMAAEFNIEPVSTFKEWNRNIAAVMGQLESMLPKGHTLDAVPAVRFDPEVFDAAPAIAKELGCSPDFDAWTGDVNPPPSCNDEYLRTASGHIHIGWTDSGDLSDLQHITHCRDLVKQLDWYLGGWSVAMDPDMTRRRLYGKAGACRYKTYGVEYRVLSNFWITTRDRRCLVWNRMQQAIHDMRSAYLPDRASSRHRDALLRLINEGVSSKDFSTNFRFPVATLDSSYRRV